MQQILDKEFTEQLQEIGAGIDIINNIKDTTSKFDTVTKYILSRQREQVSPIFGEWDTSTLTPGEYMFRLVVTDNLGNELPPCAIQVMVEAKL